MRLIATLPSRLLWSLALLIALAFLPGGSAQAQVDPFWDHYKVYNANPKISVPIPAVTLIDQFGAYTHQVQYLDFFANPVEKRHGPLVFPIHRSELHYTWWRIDPQPFSKDVIAVNQFGEKTIHVGDAAYLLNPALKNAPQGFPLPTANHYKCYNCTGDPVIVDVFLQDQFYGRPAQVLSPRFFCTPVDKIAFGQTHPMVDARQHYTVYDIDPGPPIFQAIIRDQFILPDLTVQLNLDRFLMVPTDKVLPTPTDQSTWGRVKGLYR